MQINLIADYSVAYAPSGFTQAIQTAVNYLDSAITSNITLNIRYGWGTYYNQADSSLTGVDGAEGGTHSLYTVSFASVESWLNQNATSSLQRSAYGTLSGLGLSGTNVYVSSAQEKALGYFTGSSSAIDGAIGFGTGSTNSSEWVGTALHEITHAMGRLTIAEGLYYPSIMDLFRYGSYGSLQWSGGSSAYLSTDGGSSRLADFSTYITSNGVHDYGDLSNNSSLSTEDPFNFQYDSGTYQYLTSLDDKIINLLGFNENTTPNSGGAVFNDLNGDGNADILWQNAGTGGVYLWEMNGYSITGSGFLGASTQNLTWKVITTGDVNGDGKSDLIWQNQATGGVYGWEMNGLSISGTGYIGASTQDLNWKVIATGDINGDGKSDLIWQNQATGGVYGWEMNGLSVSGMGYIGASTQDLNWKVVTTADINGDGKSDLIWQNQATGGVYAWEMNGLSISGMGYIGATNQDLNWKIVASGDLNGDGKSDLIWQNQATGGVYAWELNGYSVTGMGFLGASTQNLNWKVVGAEDINGDGKSDLIWQNQASGGVYAWEMNGMQVAAMGYLGSSTQDLNWHVIARNGQIA